MTARTSPRPRHRASALVAAVAVGLAALLTASPAQASDLHGRVFFSGGQPAAGDAKVRFIGYWGSRPDPVDVAPDGTWSMSFTPFDCGWLEAYSVSGHWSTERTSQRYCFSDQNPTLTMVPAGTVSGTVTTGAGAAPATSVVALTTAGKPAYRGPVASDGSYRLSGIEPGQYRIAFDHSAPTVEDDTKPAWTTTDAVRYWNGDASGVPETPASSASVLTVVAGQDTTGVDAEMQKGGAVSGALTCVDGSSPTQTDAHAVSRPQAGEAFVDRYGHSDSGTWAVTGQSTGVDYTYLVDGCSVPVFTGNTLNPFAATTLPRGASTHPTLDLRTARLFLDVDAHTQFAREMQWAVMRGIANGYPDGTYRPTAPVLRDAMAAFLYRLAGSPAYTPPAVSPFADVPTSRLFYKEMAWLYSRGISTGWVSGGKRYYKPDLAVARDAMAAFLSRFAGVTWDDGVSSAWHFEDVTASMQFHAVMQGMFFWRISYGWRGPTGWPWYYPDRPVTRDAMAAFLYRLDDLMDYRASGLDVGALNRPDGRFLQFDPRVLDTLKSR